ncbi:THAP-type domain-containing protein [Aphis craccivora]|uniref:THAP-type domain-containing protein n=1 Tax=Aphis craccivora TaxID=307492 RepID=A0A6G0YAQ7_APHCR|nr:THAP-type domain-containing protein [Aphis craccivora]
MLPEILYPAVVTRCDCRCRFFFKKLIPVLQCPNYIKALIGESNNINGHAYCQKNKKSFNNLTNIKNRGGLQLASESVFKIVKLTEIL